jgi:hypothetical protein
VASPTYDKCGFATRADIAGYLDVGADLHPGGQPRTWAQIGERADFAVRAYGRRVAHGPGNLGAFANGGVDQRDVRTDRRTVMNGRGTVQIDRWVQGHVRRKVHAGIDPGGRRVDHRHAGPHMSVEQPTVVDLMSRGELDAIVDAGNVARRSDNGRYAPTVRDQDSHDVWQIFLALRVISRQAAQRSAQRGSVECVHTRGDLIDCKLPGTCVFLLDDPLDALPTANDSSVSGRVVEDACKHSGGGPAAMVLREEGEQAARLQ